MSWNSWDITHFQLSVPRRYIDTVKYPEFQILVVKIFDIIQRRNCLVTKIIKLYIAIDNRR